MYLPKTTPDRIQQSFPFPVQISASSVQLARVPDTTARVRGPRNSNPTCIQLGRPPVGGYTLRDEVRDSF